jgi:hypothetical protein
VRAAEFEDGQLLSEREILQNQVTMLTEGGEERRDAGNQTTDHLADYIGSKPGNPMFSANSDFWRWTGHSKARAEKRIVFVQRSILLLLSSRKPWQGSA